MIEILGKGPAKAYGNGVIAWARFAPSGSAAQTLADSFGIKSITRTGAGTWTVALAEKPAGFVVIVQEVENDATNLHYCRSDSHDYNAGTFVATHRTAAYGSLASLALSDTVDQIQILVMSREQVT